jgi:hypothetical protein
MMMDDSRVVCCMGDPQFFGYFARGMSFYRYHVNSAAMGDRIRTIEMWEGH